MEKINAYKCGFCNKILRSYSGMWKHENKCFKNPKSKSCATCKYRVFELMVNGRVMTDKDMDILSCKVDGTYTIEHDIDTEGNKEEYSVLKDEFRYLYEADLEDFCTANNGILIKLKTQCELWKENK